MPAQSRSADKGIAMEDALKAYFFEAGYFVVRGLPYRLDGEDVTDVDLWMYERPAAANRRRIIVDVKNKKTPKAAERIIWAKGLQAALGADNAIVATTDRRSSSKRLAKSLGVILFDGEAIDKLTNAKRLSVYDVVPSSEFEAAVKTIDISRRSTEWREAIHDARSSMLSGLGVHSANRCLSSFAFFAQQAISAHPNSQQAGMALRLAYLTASLAMIGLDYVVADNAFRPADERRLAIINAVRFGQAEASPALSGVNTALNLARRYAQNGPAVARQIELAFMSDAEKIPAEIIGDFVSKVSAGDTAFQIARELEHGATKNDLVGFDALPAILKATLGAFLDFAGLPRDAFAKSYVRVERVATPVVRQPGTDPANAQVVLDTPPPAPLENVEQREEKSEEHDSSKIVGPLFEDRDPRG